MKPDLVKEAAHHLVNRLLEDQEIGWDLTNVAADPLEKQLTAFLKAAGVQASYEYPGYVAVRTKSGDLEIGTANGDWGLDFIDDGQNIEDQAGAPYDAWRSNISHREPSEVTPAELIRYILPMVAWADKRIPGQAGNGPTSRTN